MFSTGFTSGRTGPSWLTSKPRCSNSLQLGFRLQDLDTFNVLPREGMLPGTPNIESVEEQATTTWLSLRSIMSIDEDQRPRQDLYESGRIGEDWIDLEVQFTNPW